MLANDCHGGWWVVGCGWWVMLVGKYYLMRYGTIAFTHQKEWIAGIMKLKFENYRNINKFTN